MDEGPGHSDDAPREDAPQAGQKAAARDLNRRMRSGLRWGVSSKATGRVFDIIILIILARILGPEPFGLVALTMVILNFTSTFATLGLDAAIIQRKDLEKRHMDSAFWVNLTMGVVLAMGAWAGAPWLAVWFDQPMMEGLLRLGAFTFLLISINVVQRALLIRELRFRSLAMRRGIGAVIGGAVAVGLALAGYGAWSLMWMSVTRYAIGVIVFWSVGKWVPGLRFEWRAVREIFQVGGWLAAFEVVNYFTRNLDRLLVGKFVGAHALGLYAQAQNLVNVPIKNFTKGLDRVMFATLAKVHHDLRRFQNIYLRSTQAIGYLVMPAMAGIVVIAGDLVALVLGAAWLGVVPIFQIMGVASLIQPILRTQGWIFKSFGRTKIQFWLSIVKSGLALLAYSIGILWGVEGVAWAFLGHIFITGVASMAISLRIAHIPWTRWLGRLAATLAITAAMAAIVLGATTLLDPDWSPWMRLAILVPLGAVSYFAMMLLFQVEAHREFWAFARRQWNDIRGGRHA